MTNHYNYEELIAESINFAQIGAHYHKINQIENILSQIKNELLHTDAKCDNIKLQNLFNQIINISDKTVDKEEDE